MRKSLAVVAAALVLSAGTVSMPCLPGALGADPPPKPPRVKANDPLEGFYVTWEEGSEGSGPAIRDPSDEWESDVRYEYEYACGWTADSATLRIPCASRKDAVECGTEGLKYLVTSTYPDGTTSEGVQCVEKGETEPALGLDDVQRAFEQVPLPESDVYVQPVSGNAIVNKLAVFSAGTDTGGFRKDLTLLGTDIELLIKPAEWTWDPGDNSGTFTTEWPGRRWEEGLSEDTLVGRTYEQPSTGGTYPITVDTTWQAWFRLKGDTGWTVVPDYVTVEGDPFNLRVMELRAYLELTD
jgi:hypothetical protein